MMAEILMKPIATCILAFACLVALKAQKEPPRQFELKAESAAFWKLIDRGAKLDRVAGGFGFIEGPVWDQRGFLYVSDEEQNKIFRVFPDGRRETVFETGDPDGSTF